jgi:hypothetical protein
MRAQTGTLGLLSGFLALLLGTSPVAGQGTLERMRLATHEAQPWLIAPSPPGPPVPAPPPHTLQPAPPNYFSGDASAAGELLGLAAVGAAAVATSPFWGPFMLLGEDLGVRGYFPGYPYAVDPSGYMQLDYNGTDPRGAQQTHFGDPAYLREWSARLAVEDGNDFRGLNRLDGQFFFDTSTRFALQGKWSYFHEDLGGGRSDESFLGDSELTFRFVQREWLQMQTGLGWRLLADRYETRAGVNFVYQADFFPIQPVVVSAAIDLGNLDAAFVVGGRISAGVIYRNWEVLTGYDFLRIGGVNLQGPLLGLRIWF